MTQPSVNEVVSPWPAWFRHTASATIGAAVIMIPGILAYGHLAEMPAKVADHEERLRALEKSSTDAAAAMRGLVEKVDETRADLKEVLRRLPPR